MNKRDFIKIMPVWIAPVVMSVSLPAHAETSKVIIDKTPHINPPINSCPNEWTKSSFSFTDGPVVCNVGDGPSVCEIRWEIWRYVTVNHGSGPSARLVNSGTIPPLGVNGCYDFTRTIFGTSSAYDKTCLIVYQDEGHPGIGSLKYCY